MTRISPRNHTQTSPSETVDIIADLVTLLNQIDGLDFVEDAWIEKAPQNYGVVELTGQTGAEYADGNLLDQAFGVRITIYVSGGSHTWVEAVQAKLLAADIGFSMPTREYVQSINKVSWVWNCTVLGPIEFDVEAEPDQDPVEEESENTESDGNG